MNSPIPAHMPSHALEPRWLENAAVSADWEFTDEDTRYLTHNLHRYSGKFIPQIAKQAIQFISTPGETVLDPYVGSGTTLLEAAIAGRFSIGFDINPLAMLISKAKLNSIPGPVCRRLLERLGLLVEELSEDAQGPLFRSPELAELVETASKDPRLQDPWFNKWFQPEVLRQLVILRRFVDELSDERLRTLALVAFSDILRKSSNAHSGYPNVMFDKRALSKQLPARSFLRSVKDAIETIMTLRDVYEARYTPSLVHTDSRQFPLATTSVDAIVTHPPYIGSIPYAEYGLLSLKWLGHDPRELDRTLTGGKRQTRDVVGRFREAYARMHTESYRVLKRDRYMFVMVGNPLVRGDRIDLGKMTCDLAQEVGFELIVSVTRIGQNRRANKMGSERLLFFRK